MKKNPQIFWTITLLILIALVWAGFHFSSGKSAGVNSIGAIQTASNANGTTIAEGQTVTDVGSDKLFTHSILGFSFSYSKDYNITSFGNYFDSNGQTILLQKDGGQGKTQQGLQVLITPFDEDITLSVSRIKKDIPSLNMSDVKEVSIGEGDNATTIVTFSSTNNLSTGPSLEGWFIWRKNLYQISSPQDSADLFNKVISTWKLQE